MKLSINNFQCVNSHLKQRMIVMLCFSLSLSYGASMAQDYEIKFDSTNASGWFGGDNRTCCGPRDIGNGQSVFIDAPIVLNSFSFLLASEFDFPENPDGRGHEVTLTLNIRDSLGTVLQTVQETLPDTFAGGWVTWSDINMNVEANTTLIFTCYLVGALDTRQYFSGIWSDQYASYAGGVRYTKGGTGDADMEAWNDWSVHSWDASFWLRGTHRTVSVDENASEFPHRFALGQNYPNPFNPETTIQYEVPQKSHVSLAVFNLLGRRVATLVNNTLPAGFHTVQWDGNDDTGKSVASGVYIYQLQSKEFVQTRKLVLMR